MERENFFTKLRRVATSTESETARLKGCMERPIAARSSARDGPPNARLALKEMQYDAQKMKEKVQEKVTGLHASSEPFEEMLGACEGLFEITRQQVTDLETYLEQYGYKTYRRAETKQLQQDKKEQGKENVKPDEANSSAVGEGHMTAGKDPSTPPRDPASAPPVDPNKTPQLADFGISQWTIDRLAYAGLDGTAQDLKTANFTGHQYGSIPSAILGHLHLSTPQHSQQAHWQGTPFTNRTILVTPGMFGNRVIPTETPSMFIDKKSYLLNSPVPPVLMSAVKKGKPTTYDHRVTSRQGMAAASPEPEPPTITSWAEYVPLPLPPTQLHAPSSSTADVTPPMPPCLAPQAAQAPLPAEPARLTDRFLPGGAPALPCEPVQLSRQFAADHEMPAEPVRLAETFAPRPAWPEEPQPFGADGRISRAPQKPDGSGDTGVPRSTGSLADGQSTGQRPEPITPMGHPRQATLTAAHHEMPQTPELTMAYHRFVDVKPISSGPGPNPLTVPGNSALNATGHNAPEDGPTPPALQSAFHEDQCKTSPAEAATTNNRLERPLAPVTEAELSQVADYLQRLIPIDVFNQKLAELNEMLAKKQDGSFVSEAEMLTLGLGSRTKAFNLLLSKLRRMHMGRNLDSGEPVFYVVK